jgi:hypothetical protein
VADDLGRESVSVVAELFVGHAFSVAGMRQLDNAFGGNAYVLVYIENPCDR